LVRGGRQLLSIGMLCPSGEVEIAPFELSNSFKMCWGRLQQQQQQQQQLSRHPK
jgi:hypothetical protein